MLTSRANKELVYLWCRRSGAGVRSREWVDYQPVPGSKIVGPAELTKREQEKKNTFASSPLSVSLEQARLHIFLVRSARGAPLSRLRFVSIDNLRPLRFLKPVVNVELVTRDRLIQWGIKRYEGFSNPQFYHKYRPPTRACAVSFSLEKNSLSLHSLHFNMSKTKRSWKMCNFDPTA